MGLFGRKINERFSDTPEGSENSTGMRDKLFRHKRAGDSDGAVNLEAAISEVSYAPEKYTSTTSEADKTTTVTCSGCNEEIPIMTMRRNLYVCPKCGKHLKVSARRRMRNIVDPGTFRKLKTDIPFVNPLDYPEYEEKITSLKDKTGLDEGVLSGVGEIEGEKAVIAVMGSEFLMGSMGIAVGEMITNAFEVADKLKLPLIIFTASGGARMQEGILSLMQMAKTSAAAKRFSEHGGLYISCLTHPTTGGVSASFATLADITLAEPDALIGFAGPRVIEQTIGQKLPEGFQRAEYLEEHGFVDQIVARQDMRAVLAHILRLHSKKRRGK